MPIFTVSQINRYISFTLKGDRKIQGILIKGEISDFNCHYKTGHLYFKLKDEGSSIKAVMFSSAASRLKFTPEDGMAVIVQGSVAVFERDGVYQINVNDIQPDGAGAVSTGLEQLKKKLAAEGIFDISHKRPLPAMPKKIGAVTSLGGAAVRDIINILSRRYPIGEIYAVNAFVQGENASDSICRGILKAESAGCDVIIVGRGGGSSEDLNAFNSEKVAYAIYNCKVPIISAVGHEIDFTIADLAADLRAPTPSAAAELVAPSVESLLENVNILERRIKNSAVMTLNYAADKLNQLNICLTAHSPESELRLNKVRIDSIEQRIRLSAEQLLARSEAELADKAARLDSMSPLKVLLRGYSLVYYDEKLVKDADELNKGDRVKICFGKGEAEAEII